MIERENHNNYNDQDIHRIELYLENNLSEAEVKEFEKRLMSDKDFKNLYENYKKAVSTVKLFGHQQLKNKLKQIHNEEIKPRRFSKPARFTLLRIAAVFLGILVLSLPIYYIAFHKSSSERIYDNYFTPYNDIITEKGNATNTENPLNAAMFYYNNKNYSEANIIFSNIFKKIPNNDTVIFYHGISLLAEKKSVQAIEIFKKLKEDKTSIFNNYGITDWYLALAYIKGKDKVNAKKILNDLANKKNDYSRKAKEILKSLK